MIFTSAPKANWAAALQLALKLPRSSAADASAFWSKCTMKICVMLKTIAPLGGPVLVLASVLEFEPLVPNPLVTLMDVVITSSVVLVFDATIAAGIRVALVFTFLVVLVLVSSLMLRVSVESSDVVPATVVLVVVGVVRLVVLVVVVVVVFVLEVML